jgi:quercetin dioxygenase-like cupin family protein
MDFVALDLTRFAAALMGEATESERGLVTQRVSLTDENGTSRMRVIGIGITAGRDLPEHDNPGEAMLQVLSGSVTLHSTDGRAVPLTTGMLAPVPQARHRVEAHETSALLLVQVPRG